MQDDGKDILSIDAQTNELLAQWLSGNKEQLSQEDGELFKKNRQALVQYLNEIFSKTVPALFQEEECVDADALFWGLRLARFLEAFETFEWIKQICYSSEKKIDCLLGQEFITEELPYLIADTMNSWHALQPIIENSKINEFIRGACLEACVIAVVKNRVDRFEIIRYFQHIFLLVLSGEFDDGILCSHLVGYCVDLWPGECLEEIKELFALHLLDESYIQIDDVLKGFSQGKESCIKQIQKKIEQHSFYETNELNTLDEARLQGIEQLLKKTEQARIYVDQILKGGSKGLLRNELCRCGSGKKYKKCCMNKEIIKKASSIGVEESMISCDPFEESEAMQAIPKNIQEPVFALCTLIYQNPEKVLRNMPPYILQYPDIPMLYHCLYEAYVEMGQFRNAVKIMEEIIARFPDFLFGQIEYAFYLLRRGEGEKVPAVFNHAKTLSQLYPERKVFHVSEWCAFAHVMSLFCIQQGDIEQAKIYLSLIQTMDSNNDAIKDIQAQMKKKVFLQSLNLEQSTFTTYWYVVNEKACFF